MYNSSMMTNTYARSASTRVKLPTQTWANVQGLMVALVDTLTEEQNQFTYSVNVGCC